MKRIFCILLSFSFFCFITPRSFAQSQTFENIVSISNPAFQTELNKALKTVDNDNTDIIKTPFFQFNLLDDTTLEIVDDPYNTTESKTTLVKKGERKEMLFEQETQWQVFENPNPNASIQQVLLFPLREENTFLVQCLYEKNGQVLTAGSVFILPNSSALKGECLKSDAFYNYLAYLNIVSQENENLYEQEESP